MLGKSIYEFMRSEISISYVNNYLPKGVVTFQATWIPNSQSVFVASSLILVKIVFLDHRSH